MSNFDQQAEKPKVLIVDDDEGNLLALRIALRDVNCEVICCTSGPQALDYISLNEVAVIFLDVRMPGMDGYEVAQKARKNPLSTSTPIIFVTGSEPTAAHVDKMFDAGGTDFIYKPVHIKSFLTKASFFVDMFSKTRELKNKTALLQQSAEVEKASLLENALDAVVGANEQNQVTFWNKNAEEIFGWSKAEILNQDLSVIIPERFRAAHNAGMKRFVATGIARIQNQRIEVVGLRKDGREFLMELTVSSMPKETGYSFYSFMRDISEQKRVQEAVKSQAERLKLITNAIPDIIGYVRKNLQYEFANASYEVWFGKTQAEVVGKEMREVIGDQVYQHVIPQIEKVLTGKTAHFMTKLTKPDGATLLADVRFIPDLDSNQELRGFVVVAHDITELEKNREIVQNQSKYLELILNRVQAAVMLVDPLTGQIIFSNEVAENSTGGLAKDVNRYGNNYKLINSRGQVLSLDMYPRSRASRGEKIMGEEYTWVTPAGSWDYIMFSDLLPATLGQPATAMVSFLDVTPLKNVERNLRQKEEELRNLANAIPQMAWMANPDGSIFWYNQRWYEYTGTSFDETHGWGWKKVHHPEFFPKALEVYKKALVSGESVSIEFPIRSARGDYRWFLNQWLPLKTEDGKIVRWFGTHTDIHEQKMIREDQEFRANLSLALNSMEDLHGLLLSATKAVAQYLNVKRCFVTQIQDKTAKILGDYSAGIQSLTGEYQLELFGPELVQAWMSGKVLCVENVETHPLTKKHADSQKTLGIHSFITVPLMRGETLVGAMNVADDQPKSWSQREIELVQVVAETVWSAIQRSELLAALKLSTQRSTFIAKASKALNSSLETETILRMLSDLTVPEIADWCSIRMLDNDGSLKQVAVSHKDPKKAKWGWDLQNRFPPKPESPHGPYQVLRTSKPELITHVTEDMIRNSSASEEQVQTLLSIGMSSFICVPILCRDRVVGTLSVVHSEESGLRYSAEDLALATELGVRAGIAIDNARLYREAQSLNRLKDEFLANLSHELRTPMNVIQGYAELLQSEGLAISKEDFTDYVDAIQRNGKALTSIIADLLDVSSIITGKISYKPSQLNPKLLIPQILESLKPTAAAKKVDLRCDISAAPEKVAADSTRLHQIVWNLVSNAIKFTEAGGRVDVIVTQSPKAWSVSVTDTGRGIDAEFLPYVFDRFRQEDASSTRRFGGLGLGLSVVRHLVELHGGSVHAFSKGRGTGASFTVTLPLEAADAAAETTDKKLLHEAPATKNSTAMALQNTNILLVEDSADGRSLIGRFLTQAGAQVEMADSAAQARELLKTFKPDVIVSDIGMPEEDGIEFLQRLRKEGASHLRNLPAIALTAFVRNEEKSQALAAGFQMHLGKPIDANTLVEAILKAMRRPQ